MEGATIHTKDATATVSAAVYALAPPTKPKRPTSTYDAPTAEKLAFGKRMRESREIAGLDQAEAAQALGYSQQVQLSLIESGQRMPTARVLMHCAVLYGTTMDYLCGFAADIDRDPAAVVQREVAGRVVADVRRLIATITASATVGVRQLRRGAGRTAGLAGQLVELPAVLPRRRVRDGETFDRGFPGALSVRSFMTALMTTHEHLSAVAQAQRPAAAVPVHTAGLTGQDGVGGPGGLAHRAAWLCSPVPLPMVAMAEGLEPVGALVLNDNKEEKAWHMATAS